MYFDDKKRATWSILYYLSLAVVVLSVTTCILMGIGHSQQGSAFFDDAMRVFAVVGFAGLFLAIFTNVKVDSLERAQKLFILLEERADYTFEERDKANMFIVTRTSEQLYAVTVKPASDSGMMFTFSITDGVIQFVHQPHRKVVDQSTLNRAIISLNRLMEVKAKEHQR